MIRKVQPPCKFVGLRQHLNLMFWDFLTFGSDFFISAKFDCFKSAIFNHILCGLHFFYLFFLMETYEGTCAVKSFYKAELCLETLRDCCGLTFRA